MNLFTTGVFYVLGSYIDQVDIYGDPYPTSEAFAFHLINFTYTL